MRRRFLKTSKDVISNYLTIEALEDGLTVSLKYAYCLYCVDGDKQWKLLDNNIVTINSGQTVSFKDASYSSSFGCGIFEVNKKFNLVGNAMSMLFGDKAKTVFDLSNYPGAFKQMFLTCYTLQSVSPNLLPATTLADHCYNSMFYDCTSLTTSPKLPATTLALNCYGNMFEGCTSLTTAPELPTTTLADHCYNNMFYGCTKLNYIKMLATDTTASFCLYRWVSGVASTGTFVKNPAMTSLPTATLSNYYAGIPSGWTVVNDGEE